MLSPIPAFTKECLTIASGANPPHTVPLQSGDRLGLRFKHSIYGSTVEEILTVRNQAFQLFQLRYSEARLVEFYGHEQAQQENGMWVVTPQLLLLPELNLRVSDDGEMSFTLHSATQNHAFSLSPGGTFRIAVIACR